MPIRVYEYGCGRGRIEGLDAAIDQMRRRTDFWNHLVEIDHDVRARMNTLLFAGECETELDSLRTALGNLRRNRSNGNGDGDSSTQNRPTDIAALRSAIRSKLDEVKRLRKRNAAKYHIELRQLDAERKARIAQAQAGAGLYWANRDEIRRTYESARARAIREGRQLKPKLWDETGKVVVQFQRGLAVPRAFLQNGRLQIGPLPEGAWSGSSRAERRRLTRTRIRIRVSAKADRSPVWISVPAVLHRPMPHDGVIRGVSFVRDRVGVNWRHRILFVVSEAAFSVSTRSSSAVGVDLGWRLTSKGLRVAYWAGDDGECGELLLPPRDLNEFKRIGSLQGAIVAAHEQARTRLTSFLARKSVPDDDIRKLIDEAIKSPSVRALVHLFEEWTTHRFAGDRYAFSKLRDWHKQHIHLWTWQANLRDQLLRRRRELYRRLSANLSERYGKVFVNDIQLRSLVEKPAASVLAPVQRQHRFIAAISVLDRILHDACEKRGAILERVKCKGATISCHLCGATDDWSPRTTLMHSCSKCGRSWDQDYNAAMHVLKHGKSLSKQREAEKG
jgi:hypothetical protein